MNTRLADRLSTRAAGVPRKLLIAGVLLLAGCVTAQPDISTPEQPRAEETQPMIALEAWRDDVDFFIKYRLGDGLLYAGGNWHDRVELVERPAAENYAVPTLVPIQYYREQPWDSLPRDAVEIPVFAVEQWRLLRDRLLRTVVPADGGGLVVDFGGFEYFLYYDKGGEFQATRFNDKPANYRVRERLRFDQFMSRGRPILEHFLREQGITQTEFAFNTGDTGWYSLPFLYINVERKLLVFVRNVPLTPGAKVRLPGLKGGQAFGHVLHSHLSNLLLRPVSSLSRLFFTVTDTAVSTLRFDWTTGLAGKPVPPLADAEPMDLRQWEADLERIASRPATRGEVDLLVDGEAFFARFIDSVSRARESVRLQTYIFDNDDYATGIGELLKRRSNEGIDVKVLLDGFGTITGTMAESESVPQHYRPPASVRRFLERDSRVEVRQKANPWFTGDHVKSTVVDQRVAFIGGMNIGREYRYDWHDLMIELRGPVVDEITHEFDLAWSHAGPLGDIGYLVGQAFRKPRRNEQAAGVPLRLLLTGPGNYEIHQAQLQAARRARSYIYLQNAYFTDDSLLRELVMARRRGVDVRVIVPLETDHGPITRSNVLAVNLMLEHGIRVYIYPGFSHVKASIFDGWACVGSANFDRLSLRVNRELNIAGSDPEFSAQLLERLFERDFRVAPELTEPIPERWIDHLVEIVGDYLY
ncbi:MAG TPA: phosphatidylserine/phosphatidylglycerophosphate/cardiolipin synthase family protein [Gammaproteobacteria bacterium]|jgi:cardiolipin synthase